MSLSDKLAEADDAMRAGRPADAQQAYKEAWVMSRGAVDDGARVWILLSIAHASLQLEDFEEAFEACKAAQHRFAKSSRVVAGNPLFHLFAGLAYFGLDEAPEHVTEHFCRALICGGQEIFAGEDPRHLGHAMTLLEPPAELGTWTGYEGCSRDLLNGATGYLRELLTERLGAPPPYTYDPAP